MTLGMAMGPRHNLLRIFRENCQRNFNSRRRQITRGHKKIARLKCEILAEVAACYRLFFASGAFRGFLDFFLKITIYGHM